MIPRNFNIVTKDSKTGFTSHQRLLVLKAGHLYYYSRVPKSFDGDPKILEYVHELPKSSIYVMNIKKIKKPNKRESKNLYNTYTQDVRLQQFEMSYQQKPNKIEDTINGMKKNPKQKIAF